LIQLKAVSVRKAKARLPAPAIRQAAGRLRAVEIPPGRVFCG